MTFFKDLVDIYGYDRQNISKILSSRDVNLNLPLVNVLMGLGSSAKTKVPKLQKCDSAENINQRA